MKKRWLILLAAPVLAVRPAQAQEELQLPDAAALEQMCSPTGMFQYAFGQTGVPGADKVTYRLAEGFTLPASAAPFEHAKPRSTDWSDRLFAIEYTGPRVEDDEALQAYAQKLDAILEPAGWKLQPVDFDPPLYMLSIVGDRTWTRQAETGNGPTQLVLGLSRTFGEMVLACGRADLMSAHASEALGDLPPGTPRPQVPNIPVPAVRAEVDCGRPEIVAEMEGMFRSTTADRFLSAMLARTTYRDRLTTWMAWKLEQSGRIPEDQLLELILSATGEASPGGDPFSSFALIAELFPLIERMADAMDTGDPRALCRSVIPFHEFLAKADALTLAQTEAVQVRLTEEAGRLGVSFD